MRFCVSFKTIHFLRFDWLLSNRLFASNFLSDCTSFETTPFIYFKSLDNHSWILAYTKPSNFLYVREAFQNIGFDLELSGGRKKKLQLNGFSNAIIVLLSSINLVCNLLRWNRSHLSWLDFQKQEKKMWVCHIIDKVWCSIFLNLSSKFMISAFVREP